MIPVFNNPGCNGIPEGFVDMPKAMSMDEKIDFMRQKSTQMGYRFVGRHAAVKVCSWTRESIRGKNVCYKNKFYGIESNQCIQMTPVMFFCTFNCLHCWRNFDYMLPRQQEEWDEPKAILDGCIREQTKLLQGFFGSSAVDKEKLHKAMTPKHVA
ncbi:MAG: 4-demethylwyosine synthase TYW1, partial [Candidatus Aenigmarchaeota archaeon]|nr:4-demethylwyosine synthase TYW1 [Candidatus Aenigmarchaeota archaeon]